MKRSNESSLKLYDIENMPDIEKQSFYRKSSLADQSYRDSSGKPTLKKQKTNPVNLYKKISKNQKTKLKNEPRMEYLIESMPVEKTSLEEVEDEYDRTISESIRIRIMIENSIFKTKNSNEFSYGSEVSGSPSAGR